MTQHARADVFERRVLDALPLTIYTVDLDGRITSANRAWSRFAAGNGAPELVDESAVVGRPLLAAIVDPDTRATIERAMELLRSGRVPTVSWEFPCSSPDTERIFLMQVALLADNDLRPAGFVFSTVDITASQRSREALLDTGIALSRTIALDRVFHEVGVQLRRALRCEAFVIAVTDDDTAAFRIAHAFGYRERAVDDSNDSGGESDDGDGDAQAGDDDDDALARRLAPVWLEALASGRVVVRPTDDGIELTAPMATPEGALGAITITAGDIDSPQRLDEATRVFTAFAAQTAAAVERAWLVRRVEHKRRLEAIGEVATGVAHEIRNPLFGISSAAQLLRFRTREDPVVEKNVGRILREVDRLNRMVTSLLEYGRPSALRLAPGDPDLVWDEVLELNRGRLESRALLLRRTRAEPAGRCAIDAEQLSQVLVNVLVNAVDAAPEASDLTLVSSVLPSGGWRCRLHNGGPGIPAEQLPRVFEMFYSTKTGGTGIGLALCQRIMTEHGGTITLDSVHDRGTTLTLTLPPAAGA